jgi:hypothetical protein
MGDRPVWILKNADARHFLPSAAICSWMRPLPEEFSVAGEDLDAIILACVVSRHPKVCVRAGGPFNE